MFLCIYHHPNQDLFPKATEEFRVKTVSGAIGTCFPTCLFPRICTHANLCVCSFISLYSFYHFRTAHDDPILLGIVVLFQDGTLYMSLFLCCIL